MIRSVALLSLLFTLLCSPPVIPCEYHNTPMFGVFGMQHVANRVLDNFHDVPLELDHVYHVSSAVGEPVEIEVSYKVPLAYQEPTLIFATSKEATVTSKDTVTIDRLKGVHIVTVQANAKGSHTLTIHLEATRNGKPYSRLQRLTLSAG